MIKLIASDLDGTLLLNHAQSLNPGTAKLIHELTKQGRIFAAASQNHAKAVDWRHIQSLTTSVGEILEGTAGTPDSVSEFLSGSTQNSSTLIWYYDENWEICSSEKASHKMTLILSTDAMIKEGTLTFYSVHEKKETEFYQTELAFPTISSDRKEASS